MAAIFTIPYETDIPEETERCSPWYDPAPRSGATVLAFDRRRAARRRRAVRRRNVRLALASVTLFAVVVFGLAAVFSVIDGWSQPPAAGPVTVPAAVTSGVSGGEAAGSVVVVQSGDTLTSIARELQPTGNITGLVDRLAAQHGPAPLQAGDRLVVDAGLVGTGG